MTSRRICHLGVAAILVTLATGSSEARAHGYRGADLDHHHWRLTRAPARGYGAAADGRVPVCADVLSTPMARCRETVGVMVALDEALAVPKFSRRTVAELNLIRSVERGVEATARRHRLAAQPAMLYGIEPEPVLQFQLKREMLVLLSRFTGQAGIGRAATGLSPTSSIRAFAESEAIERTRVRATFIQIEEFRGPNPLATPVTAQVAFAALGASLFWSGLAGQKLLNGALGDALVILPQPWPPGIQIKGSFDSP